MQPPRTQELIASGLQHHRAGRFVEAEQLYETVLRTEPEHADALHLLGLLCHQAGRNERAVTLIERAIARNPRVPSYHNNLGNALNAQGLLAAAADAYARALALKADYAEAHFNLGIVRAAQGRFLEAADCYRTVLAQRPDHAEAHGNLGNVLQAQGLLAEALDAYRLALKHRPGYAEVHSNAGNVLRALGRNEEAAAEYAQAISLQPRNAAAHHNLGNLLLEQGKPEEAAASFRRALAQRSDYPQAHVGLGNALKELGEREAAELAYRCALAHDPGSAEARLGLAGAVIPVVARDAADSAQVVPAFLRSLDELCAWSRSELMNLGRAVGSHQPFYLAYRPQDIRAALDRYGDLMCAAAAARWPHAATRMNPSPGRVPTRPRLLVVSHQVRSHPVWDVVLRGILAHVDRSQLELILYHTGALTDGETRWAAEHVDRFVQGPRPVAGWLEEVKRDGPDLIFYPEIGMDPTTGALAALRLAPVQMAGWGHPVTTGLPSIDVFVSGQLLEGPGAAQHYREKLLLLPGTGVCTHWRAERLAHWSGPERRRGVVRFALCQQPTKFDPAYDTLLARIAREAGASEFWLVAPDRLAWATSRLRERLASAFRVAGLDPEEHLRISPWLRREQFLGFLDDMDVFLDCPAFSGYTTAWAAIHRGLPIVAREGEFLRQRLASGLLRQTALTDGIASSDDRYVEIAVRFAAESRVSADWKRKRQAILEAARLSDDNVGAIEAFTRAVSALVRRGTGAAI